MWMRKLTERVFWIGETTVLKAPPAAVVPLPPELATGVDPRAGTLTL